MSALTSHHWRDRHKRRYGLVRVPGTSNGLTPPLPNTVPEVALSEIPDRVGPTRATTSGDVHIVFRLTSDPVPDALDAVDWVDVDTMREHIRQNADKWGP